MIKIIEGNLFDTTAPIIAHQVNCKGVMGSGVAAQIKKLYPEVFQQYQDLCYANRPKILLGTAQPCRTQNGDIIVNLFGQEDFGYNSTIQFTDTSALAQALYGLRYFMENKSTKVIALPYKIGCGRGNANWDGEVYPLIKSIFLETDIDVELWKL